MGCAASKPVEEAAVAAPTAPQDIPIVVKVPPTSPFDSAHTGTSGPAPPQPPLPRVPSRLLNRPDSSGSPLQWRLDDHEIATNSTLNALVAVKEELAGMAPMGSGRGRVSLTDGGNMWFLTTLGAFSPVSPLAGSTLDSQLRVFKASGDTTLVIPDVRQVPALKDHPSVMKRPHLSFYAGAPMVSRLSAAGPHVLGVAFTWASRRGRDFIAEELQRLEGLAERGAAALQAGLLRAIGAAPGSVNVDLPMIWFDPETPSCSIRGVNAAWVALTGVGPEALVGAPDMMSLLAPADGSSCGDLKMALRASATLAGPEARISAVVSPQARPGASLQFVVVMRPAGGAVPPRDLLLDPDLEMEVRDSASGAAGAAPRAQFRSLWVMEVHARVQADTHGASGTELNKFLFSQDESVAPESIGVGALAAAAAPFLQDADAESSVSGSEARGQSTAQPASAFGDGGPCVAGVPPRLAALRFQHRLGGGSYGDVYAGRLGSRPVAIKIIEIPGSAAPGAAAAAAAAAEDWAAHYEAVLAVDVPHDNVVATLDWCRTAGAHGGQVWIVQELCTVGPLGSALAGSALRRPPPGAGDDDSSTRPDMRAVLLTAADVARGMRFLHSMDEIHGDLSANNVMLTAAPLSAADPRGFVGKVTDFGLSRLSGTTQHATQTHGTVSHMPPEVLMEGRVGKPTDIYSFGVLLWELWSGRRAWEGKTHAQVVFAVCCEGKRLELPPEAPAALVQLAEQCTNGDPAARPGFDDILARLEAILEATP